VERRDEESRVSGRVLAGPGGNDRSVASHEDGQAWQAFSTRIKEEYTGAVAFCHRAQVRGELCGVPSRQDAARIHKSHAGGESNASLSFQGVRPDPALLQSSVLLRL
jgi:hypothetical protein